MTLLEGGTYLIFPLVKLILGPPFLIIIAQSLTLENRKLRLENQMVRSFPFGNLQKIWAVICRDAIFLLLLVCSADFDILRSGSFTHHVEFLPRKGSRGGIIVVARAYMLLIFYLR